MNKFNAGNTYTGRFVSDADSTFEVSVVKTTKATVTFVHPHTKEQQRGKLHTDDCGVQFFFPLGRYSMAPTVKADRLVEAA